jgi:DNA-binding MarR family transcriptional regulator
VRARSTDGSLGILIVAARHAMRHAICERARKFRLTTQQFWALERVSGAPGLTVGDLAATLLLDAPATSRLVQQLGARKLLELRPDRDDRRRLRLHLAPRGSTIAAEVIAIAASFHDVLVRGMSEAEAAALRGGLVRVVDNLSAFGVATGAVTACADDEDLPARLRARRSARGAASARLRRVR